MKIPVTVAFGADSGSWTAAMDQSERFRDVYVIDDSFRSLSVLAETVVKSRMHLVCQSAEQLDFEAGSVDVIVGRSFLCRVSRYEALLAKFARWLKPDGAAIFYEPCIQGKIWIGFLTRLMLEFGTDPDAKGWDAMRRKLDVLYRKDLEQPRAAGEDKWIFDVDALRETAQAGGFLSVNVVDEDGRVLTGFKRAILGAITDRSRLARCSATLDAFGDTFSNSAPRMLVSPMVFFVFRKTSPRRRRKR